MDAVFLAFFASHIPITLFVDIQALLPRHWFPAQALEMVEWYSHEFKDPFMVDPNPPAWSRRFGFSPDRCEISIHAVIIHLSIRSSSLNSVPF
eukprot:m.193262 g.193262  ORF g.193262 m.193262 type:complete len:93 (-) comp53682_c0_seq4:438-716(-)